MASRGIHAARGGPPHLGAGFRRRIEAPKCFYAQKGMKLLVTFLEPADNYVSGTQGILDEAKSAFNRLNLNFRIISRKANGEFIKFEGFLPHNKTWITLAEAMFSEDSYTKPFRIEGKSGQLNINLENTFLALIGQGLVQAKENEFIEREEVPRESTEDVQSELLE